MQEVYKTIGQIAGKEVNVLITGESGTGKELVARAIYNHSLRSTRPFLSINCAAIPESLLESELFGHERGAYTGAEHRRIGRFEQAHTGTIFLDEIGDMPIHVQAKILRFIQEGEIQRLGGSETIRVDVRMLAATNKNLESGVKDGWFREDLYYRLNVVTIHLPPLRERREDIPHLVSYFLSRFTRELHKEVLGVSREAMEALVNYRWPGNIRELENAIKRAMVICKGNEILPEHLPEQITATDRAREQAGEELENTLGPLLDRLFEAITKAIKGNPTLDIISMIEKGMIERAVRLTCGNKVQAASMLGINRNTLRNKMERYGIQDDLPRERQ
jgi:DNA-binding NtrC family response regulator